MKFLAPLALAVLASAASAQTVDLAHSQVGFTFRQLAVPVDGSFRQFAANVVFDPARPAAGRADITIQTGSIALPTTDASTRARDKAWFNVAQYPTARFVSTRIAPLADGRFRVDGKLTLKGVTREVSAPFAARVQGGVTLVEGVLPVSRLAFRIGDGEWADTDTVADTVDIKFRMALKP